jgi:anti-anti-sigma regulatory factor
VNPSPHIAEILALVGLERILVTRNLAIKSQSNPCFYRSAA